MKELTKERRQARDKRETIFLAIYLTLLALLAGTSIMLVVKFLKFLKLIPLIS